MFQPKLNPIKSKLKNNSSVCFFSPAKINLFFRLCSKRKDGFHDLESLFQAVSLGDYLKVSLSDKDGFSSNASYLSFDDHNLVIKALRVFRACTKRLDPVSITLKKNIPIQTGLGGGSSNGSTLLWALNTLLQTKLSNQELMILAEKISCDSPFFFSKGTALCSARGEEVQTLKSLEPQKGWIVKPEFGISTPKAYAFCSVPKSRMPLGDCIRSFYTPQPIFQNDLESSAFLIEPQLKTLKQSLIDEGVDTVFMTGSGSGLICLGKTPPKPKKTIQIYPFHYINRPLNQWYGEEENKNENL